MIAASCSCRKKVRRSPQKTCSNETAFFAIVRFKETIQKKNRFEKHKPQLILIGFVRKVVNKGIKENELSTNFGSIFEENLVCRKI